MFTKDKFGIVFNTLFSLMFASLFIKNPESKLFIALRILAIVVIMTAAMSFLVMFSQMGFTKMFLVAFAKSLLPSLAFAYVVALICFPFLLKLTIKLCSKEE